MEISDLKKTRREIGLAGAIIMLAQVISAFQSSRNLSHEMDDLKSEFHQSRKDQEVYFVKKQQFKNVVKKLDSMKGQLASIQRQIKSMKNYAFTNGEETIECAYRSQAYLFNNRGL